MNCSHIEVVPTLRVTKHLKIAATDRELVLIVRHNFHLDGLHLNFVLFLHFYRGHFSFYADLNLQERSSERRLHF